MNKRRWQQLVQHNLNQHNPTGSSSPNRSASAGPLSHGPARRGYSQMGQNRSGYSRGDSDRPSFNEFSASELYCPKCKSAMPVRERLLLVLPTGNLYDYTCVACSTSLGNKTTKN